MKAIADFDLDTQQLTICLYFNLFWNFEEKKKKLFCDFVDLEKAFDTV